MRDTGDPLAHAMVEFYSRSEIYRTALQSHEKEYFDGYVRVMNRFRKPGSRTLEVGCGAGNSTEALAESDATVIGAELSRFPFGDCTGRRASYIMSDASRLPMPGHSGDVIGSFDLLEHTVDAEAVLTEMARVVARNRYIVVWCPNLLSPFRPFLYLGRIIRNGNTAPVWAESVPHACSMILKNTAVLTAKMLEIRPRFMYRTPKAEHLVDVIGGDVDATYLSNPVDVRRHLGKLGFTCHMLRNVPGESPARAWLRRIVPTFVSPVVLVSTRARSHRSSARPDGK